MLLARLLTLYTFLLPLELLLSKPFGIDTIWKPYRIVAVVIVVVATTAFSYTDAKWDHYDTGFLFIFLMASTLTLIWCICGVNEWTTAAQQWIEVMLPFIIYLCTKVSVRSPSALKHLMMAFVYGAVLSALYAIYEAFVLRHTDRPSGLGGTAPDLALNSGIALGFVIFSYSAPSRLPWLNVLARGAIASILCLAAIISGTRSAWMGIALSTVAVILLMAMNRHQRRKLVKGITFAAALLIGTMIIFHIQTGGSNTAPLTGAVQQRLVWNDNLKSGSGRVEIWTRALSVASRYYYVGGGFSGFMQATAYHNNDFRNIRPQDMEQGIGSHNVFLEVLVNYGPLSFAVFCICLYQITSRLASRVLNHGERLYSCALLFSFVCLVICGCFLDLFGKPQFWTVMAFVTLSLRFNVAHSPRALFIGGRWKRVLVSRMQPITCQTWI
jgi:hypothetical protein